MPPHLDGHDPALQSIELECPEVGGDVGRVGLAAEQVETEHSKLMNGLNRPLILPEDCEIEHGDGGEHLVHQGRDVTQQRH